MLPGAYRMRRREEFTVGVRRGQRAGRPNLVMHVSHEGSAEEPPRIGFVVSKAVGNAVVRNRVQRRLRHLMAERVHRLPYGSLVVIRAHRRAAGARYVELGSDLDKALGRLVDHRAGKR